MEPGRKKIEEREAQDIVVGDVLISPHGIRSTVVAFETFSEGIIELHTARAVGDRILPLTLATTRTALHRVDRRASA